MNITLSADRKLVEKARRFALQQGKSLNQMIREYLEALAGQPQDLSKVQQLFDLMDEGKGALEGRTWTREELHER